MFFFIIAFFLQLSILFLKGYFLSFIFFVLLQKIVSDQNELTFLELCEI